MATAIGLTDLTGEPRSLSAPPVVGTYGALDMGGASTQITFQTSPSTILPLEYSKHVELYSKNYTIYSHSYLCYGVNEAVRRLKALLVNEMNTTNTIVENPCGPKGNSSFDHYNDVFEAPCAKRATEVFGHEIPPPANLNKNITYEFKGTSDPVKCALAVRKLFNFSAPCDYSRCTFNGVYQPEVEGQFLAFSTFFYVADFLNFTHDVTQFTEDHFAAAVNDLCLKDWKQVADMPTPEPSARPLYCFEGNYIFMLLTDAYGFNSSNWAKLHFTSKVANADLGWALGFMINSSTSIPAEYPTVYVTVLLFALMCVLFAGFILVSVGFGCHARKYHSLKSREDYDKLINYGTI